MFRLKLVSRLAPDSSRWLEGWKTNVRSAVVACEVVPLKSNSPGLPAAAVKPDARSEVAVKLPSAKLPRGVDVPPQAARCSLAASARH